jgi:4,5:9,10-diseco-3-hydroxy-5,9,17-trioxoandrosta-1(10),2-diene-4-oate hydrolase
MEKSASSVGFTTEIEEKFAQIDGYRVRYLQAGSGPPLLLIHGLLGYSFSWRLNLPELSRYATLYALDMPGAGFSDRPAHLDTSLRAAAHRVLRFADVLGLRSFDLLGTSHGGGVAMSLGAACTELPEPKLQRLILVAPINPWSQHGRRFAPFMASPMVSSLFKLVVPRTGWSYRYWLERMYGDPRRISKGTVEGYRAPYRSGEDFDTALKIARGWNADMADLESVLPKLADYPTLLAWGSRDPAVHVSSATPLRRVFRNCRLRIFDGVGHLPYEEVPSEFNRLLIDFLTGELAP